MPFLNTDRKCIFYSVIEFLPNEMFLQEHNPNDWRISTEKRMQFNLGYVLLNNELSYSV